MNKAHTYTIHIVDNPLSITTDESEQHVTQASARLNELMQNIMSTGRIDQKKAAFLAALQLASNTLSLENEINAYQVKEQELIQSIDQHISES